MSGISHGSQSTICQGKVLAHLKILVHHTSGDFIGSELGNIWRPGVDQDECSPELGLDTRQPSLVNGELLVHLRKVKLKGGHQA